MRFSVIIPTHNRPAELLRCLQSLTAITLPSSEWEVIVVNDGGMLTPQPPKTLPLHLVNIDHAGPAAARNAGARLAQGEFLAFTDDDCTVEADWLAQFEAGFATLHADALGGAWLNPYPHNTPAVTWQGYMNFLRDYFHDAEGNALLLPSNNIAYRREVFESLGSFDTTFPLAAAEDFEMGYRLVGGGYRQCYFPAARVWHYHRSSYGGYLRQQFRYGRGAYHLGKARGRNRDTHPIQTIPRRKGAFYAHLIRSLRQQKAPLGMWLLLGLTPLAHALGKRYETLATAFSN